MRQRDSQMTADCRSVAHEVRGNGPSSIKRGQSGAFACSTGTCRRPGSWPGRVIATGSIDTQDDPGAVRAVKNDLLDAAPSAAHGKLALLRRSALPYDSILLPEEWRSWAQLGFGPTASMLAFSQPQVVFVRNVLPRLSPVQGRQT